MDDLALTAGTISILGRSRAGQESYYRLPSLRSALETGRCPDSIVRLPFVFLTHAHLDHAAGVATYASQRTLQGLSTGLVCLPAEIAGEFEEVLEIHRRLERVDGPYRARLSGVRPGDRVPIRNDLAVRVEPSVHRVPTVGYTFLELRHRLRADLSGRPEDEIAALHRAGEVVYDSVETPILSYSGDCDAGIFDASPALFRSRVLLLECTFARPDDRDRARRYGHLHLSEIAAHAGRFENETIILTHFSARYTREEILSLVDAGLPPDLRARTITFV